MQKPALSGFSSDKTLDTAPNNAPDHEVIVDLDLIIERVLHGQLSFVRCFMQVHSLEELSDVLSNEHLGASIAKHGAALQGREKPNFCACIVLMCIALNFSALCLDNQRPSTNRQLEGPS